ncbi:MAG TPA: PEGA domain-containing protein [Anaerohalosphaeraceae bacterium]|nr:PEGA domain-containing protein [Anaerohalosphaeraceae bacterium]
MERPVYSNVGRRVLLVAVLLGLNGCVERRLTILTDPPDALVWLNDEEIGRTPVTVGFNWYGDYKVRIEKEGYEIIRTNKAMKRPPEDYFPLDFLAEVLWPGTIRRDIAWSFTLQPAVNPTAEQLLEQADAFRQRAGRDLPAAP